MVIFMNNMLSIFDYFSAVEYIIKIMKLRNYVTVIHYIYSYVVLGTLKLKPMTRTVEENSFSMIWSLHSSIASE